MSAAIHPGEMVKAGLVERGWTQRDLAAILGCHESAINRIIKGKAGISAKKALELAAAFDTTPMLWLDAWNRYRLDSLPAYPVKGTKPRVKRWSHEELLELAYRFMLHITSQNPPSPNTSGHFVEWLKEQA